MFRTLSLIAAALALGIVLLGAYVRLNDAGLGCPDWPGCYGHVAVPEAAADVARAETAFPGKPVEAHKAWLEMIHRYFATALGLLIVILSVLAWRRRGPGKVPALPTALVGVVIFQGLLGMWTVTLLLKPLIVSLHLLGGLTTFALLAVMALRERGIDQGPPVRAAVRGLALFGLLALACQIALGAWTSTNYAALACPDFPLCQGSLRPPMDFASAFHLVRELGHTADGALLSNAALTAIHYTHRLGALVVSCVLLWLGLTLLRAPGLRIFGVLLLAALSTQLSLGIAIVLLQLPLPLAVMHNGGAAVLLLVLVATNTAVRTRPLQAD
ncbi:MAG: COX15/CtaA family protein [Pseudomonadota bacterium]|nr:COX15/CtaA family protein [Pseudomonadota bacterium]